MTFDLIYSSYQLKSRLYSNAVFVCYVYYVRKINVRQHVLLSVTTGFPRNFELYVHPKLFECSYMVPTNSTR